MLAFAVTTTEVLAGAGPLSATELSLTEDRYTLVFFSLKIEV